MEQVVAKFLQQLRVPVTRQECLRLIRSHPDYPALVSISDTLDSLGIDNYVAQFGDDELASVTFPYLAYLDHGSQGGELVLVRDAAALASTRTQAGSAWTGIVVQANGMRVPASAEQLAGYQRERQLARVGWVILGVLLLLLAQPLLALPGWPAQALYLAALGGLMLGGALLAKELGVAPEVVDNLCGGGPKPGCDDVLDTDPVRLFGFFTLTDATVTYFLWQVVGLGVAALVPVAGAGLLPLLSLAALLGVPVVLFSLYQQRWVAKAWCRLCLLVDAVLLVQAGVAAYALAQRIWSWTASTPLLAVNLTLALVACAGLVVLGRQLGRSYNEQRDREATLGRQHRSVATLSALLRQESLADTSEFDQELAMGSPGAPLEIIMATNLYCNPCKQAHAQLSRLVALFPDLLRVRFRLVGGAAGSDRGPTSNRYLLHYWLANVWGRPDEAARTEELLHEWYSAMNLEKFAAAHPADFSGDHALSTELAAQHLRWVKRMQVRFTPTFFLNGRQLPLSYHLADLTLMLPMLVEQLTSPAELAANPAAA